MMYLLSRPTTRLSLLLLAVAALFTANVRAQYFGQNKVRYDHFKYEILHTRHFDIYYYAEEQKAIPDAARMAERWYLRHARVFGDTLSKRQPLILYGSHPQFEQTNVIEGELGQGTGGVTEESLRRIVLPFAASYQETDHVIGHELVHAYQYDLSGEREGRGSLGMRGFSQLPLWFVEGMAEYLSLGSNDANTAMWMRDAAANKKLPSLSDLENPDYFPYRYGQALLAYIGGRWGDRAIGHLLMAASARGNLRTAIDTVLHIKPDSLISAWHKATHEVYDSLASLTQSPDKFGPRLIATKQGGGSLNVAPALSPDGKEVVFFSERGLFSINLYLADAQTGEVKRTILHTELDPHFQGLEFISSAGAWSPDGKRFVFSAVDKGRPFLSVIDPHNGKVELEKRFPKLGEIYSPTWSPDGQRIAFSALVGGFTDLFVYDLKSDELTQLTDDPFCDLQPAWSPDGKSIVFVTDRFTTRMATLEYAGYELALMDPDTHFIRRLYGTRGSRNFNPQWSPDGKSIYFLSDPDGITNIYRMNVADESVERITNVYTGVSGITSLSPALSVALDTNRLVYSVFEKGGYSIYAIDSAAVLAGTPARIFDRAVPASLLPPFHRKADIVMRQLENPELGLVTDTTFTSTDYSPSLSLVGVTQPTAAVGIDRFGTYAGGGIALLWGDMLGNQNLATALQIQSGGGFTNVMGLVSYLNTASRVNWGAAVQQIPYMFGSYSAGYGDVSGEPSYISEQLLYRETIREADLLLSYPFSQTTRMDYSIGYQNISFKTTVNTQAFSLNTGQVVLDQSQDITDQPALNMGTASVALVYDNSIFGATSPVLGRRWRLEVDPMIGSLQQIDLLADYREYVLPVRPVTLAGRVLHYGRYGASADDPRITPLYLGYPGLVRGYDAGSFSADSPVFEELFGSKMLVANFEVRFPLFGIFGLGRGYYGWLPIETGGFFDAGVAWTNHTKPSFMGGINKPVKSAGFMARMNFFGYLIGEVDYVRSYDHPELKWQWVFNILEGF
jgi:Tol biopolymer transport system component